jgi:hypothetical protein
VVLEIAADCGQVELGLDASRRKDTFRSNAAELQDLRRKYGTSGEDDFFAGLESDLMVVVSVEHFHARGREVFVEDDLRHLVLGEEPEVLAVGHAVVVSVQRAGSGHGLGVDR